MWASKIFTLKFHKNSRLDEKLSGRMLYQKFHRELFAKILHKITNLRLFLVIHYVTFYNLPMGAATLQQMKASGILVTLHRILVNKTSLSSQWNLQQNISPFIFHSTSWLYEIWNYIINICMAILKKMPIFCCFILFSCF